MSIFNPASPLMPASFSESIPTGSIIMWSGAVDTVPDGWHICNGEEGTIDLRDRFVLGAGTNEPGATGGESKVGLTYSNLPTHSHQYAKWSETTRVSASSSGTTVANVTQLINTSTQPSGDGTPHNNMPPYYVLWYIQKIRQGTSTPTGSVESLSTDDITNIMEEKNNG